MAGGCSALCQTICVTMSCFTNELLGGVEPVPHWGAQVARRLGAYYRQILAVNFMLYRLNLNQNPYKSTSCKCVRVRHYATQNLILARRKASLTSQACQLTNINAVEYPCILCTRTPREERPHPQSTSGVPNLYQSADGFRPLYTRIHRKTVHLLPRLIERQSTLYQD